MKSEPEVYSIDDLEKDQRTMWDSIRNYQARNFMRDDMKVGDLVLFYHSNAKPPGVAGVARVCSEPYPDPTQFDESHPYFAPKSNPENPAWILVDVEFVAKFDELVSLHQIKDNANLDGMLVAAKGSRLSVQPVEPKHFNEVLAMAKCQLSPIAMAES